MNVKWCLRKSPLLFLAMAMALPMLVLFRSGNASADCMEAYRVKSEKRKSAGMVKQFVFSHSEYSKMLTLFRDAENKNVSVEFAGFMSALGKSNQKKNIAVSPSSAEVMNLIDEMNKAEVLCDPTVVKYSDLVSKFSFYTEMLTLKLNARAKAKAKAPAVDPEDVTIRHLESAYIETQGKTPYLSRFGDEATFDVATCPPVTLRDSASAKAIDLGGSVKKIVAKKLHECPLCTESKEVDDFFFTNSCDCKGKITACKECLREFYGSKIKERGYPHECLTCKGHLNPFELQLSTVLTEAEIKLWRLRELKHAAYTCPDFVKCDGKGCSNGYFKSEKGFKSYLSSGCEACGATAKICAKCNRDRHPSKTCEEVWSDRVKECEQQGASVCPTCWTAIVHDGACMHMTCPTCKTEYSEITKLKMDKANKGTEYDIGGWPIKYFYPGGVYKVKGRVDQFGRSMDAYGNLIMDVNRPVPVDIGKVDRHGNAIIQLVTIPTETIVSRDGREFFDYDPGTNKAWALNPRTFERTGEVPRVQFYKFKGEWDRIVQRARRDLEKSKTR